MDVLSDYLRDHRFPELFIDVLGWDRASTNLALQADGRSLCFQAIAQKRGVQILWCAIDRVMLLNCRLLRQFRNQLARTYHEHILIFTSEEPRKQVWMWVLLLTGDQKL